MDSSPKSLSEKHQWNPPSSCLTLPLGATKFLPTLTLLNIQFNIHCACEPPNNLWVIPNNIHEVVLCQFIVKLWTLLDTPSGSCCLCVKSFTNVFEHITTVCPEKSLYRNAWCETVIKDYNILLGPELSGLSQWFIFVSFGARCLTTSTLLLDYVSHELHLINFRYIQDVAAA